MGSRKSEESNGDMYVFFFMLKQEAAKWKSLRIFKEGVGRNLGT